MNSVSVENFLKHIYTLRVDEGKKASVGNLSERLSISGPAVTDMAKKMSVKGYIQYEPYKELELSKEGERLAVKVLRRHRLWEAFLHQVLHLNLNEVHEEAEMLEHQTSEKMTAHLDAFLKYPEFDPHGDPIPKEDGTTQKHSNANKLNDFKEGNRVKILRLIYGTGDLNDFFTHYNIQPNEELEIKKYFSVDNSIEVEKNGKFFTISEAIQQRLICTLIESK